MNIYLWLLFTGLYNYCLPVPVITDYLPVVSAV